MADTEHVGASLSSFERTGTYSVHSKGNDMDYSQILASQLIRKDTWIDNEDEFYSTFSLDGFVKLRGAFRKLNTSMMRSVSVAPRVTRKRVRYT